MPVPTLLPTLLVVDDTPENLALLGELLRPHYRIRVANSGERALRSARLQPSPDLILLDVMMPGLNGHAVLRQLSEDPLTRDIPVIFVTALDQPDDEELGLDLGAVDYITKPIRPAILLARVRTQLELKRARDTLRQHNDWLEQEVAHRMQENELVKEASLHALALLAEARDNETGNHLHRTRAYVEALARHLAQRPGWQTVLSETQIRMIGRAAPLHDIGKVGIPDHILRKPGKLTPEEYRHMQEHARIGGDAIAQAMGKAADDHANASSGPSLDFLDIARQIARHHHERWDGTGYPDRLAGQAIPLPARLMALADVFDALSFKRVYKPAFTAAAVDQMIRDGRGTHFDPEVVDAYFEVRDQFLDIASRHTDSSPPQALRA